MRMTDRDGRAGKAGKVQPLRKAHGVAVSRAGKIISLAMAECRARGNWGEQNRRVVHLAKNFGAEKIAVGAGFCELVEGDRISRGCAGEIFAQHRADLIFVASDTALDQVSDHRAKEKPPPFESAIKTAKSKWFEGEAAIGERGCGLLDSQASLWSCGA